MKQKTYLTIGLLLSLCTLAIIIFREEIKEFLIGNSSDKNEVEPRVSVEAERDLTQDEKTVVDILVNEQLNEIAENTLIDDASTLIGRAEETRPSFEGYAGSGQNLTYSSGNYQDLRANKDLSLGQDNLETLYLQNAINNVITAQNSDLPKLSLDGDFGPKTQYALISTFGVDNITIKDVNDQLPILLN